MSITTERVPYAPRAPIADLAARVRLDRRHIVACAWFGVFFLYLNYIPLFHSDIWGHVHLGKWILEHGALPAEDPFLPLAEGMRMIDTAWLSQVNFALAERLGGAEAMSTLYAATVTATYVLLARVFYLQTRRLGLALAGTLAMLLLTWTRHGIIRPEIFGGFCFAMLLWLLTAANPAFRAAETKRAPAAERPLLLWIGVPLLFLFWVNLHGTFAVGLTVLGCLALGQWIESAWQHRSFPAVLRDRMCRRWLLLVELAVAVSLVNPYGMDLLLETVRFGRNANLRSVLEWFPLQLIDFEGIQFSLVCMLIMVAWRKSSRTIRPAEVLLLAVLAASVAPTVRMIAWFVPVAIWVLMPHFGEIAERVTGLTDSQHAQREVGNSQSAAVRSATVALACALVLWICFSLSPSSAPLFSGKPRSNAQLYSRGTPVALTEHLRANPPKGLVMAPQWWGDWLAWSGPAGISVVMTTDLHLAPATVWQDYLRMAQCQPGWERLLDRYQVNTLVIHKELQSTLAAGARRTRNWQIAYEDELSMLLVRETRSE